MACFSESLFWFAASPAAICHVENLHPRPQKAPPVKHKQQADPDGLIQTFSHGAIIEQAAVNVSGLPPLALPHSPSLLLAATNPTNDVVNTSALPPVVHPPSLSFLHRLCPLLWSPFHSCGSRYFRSFTPTTVTLIKTPAACLDLAYTAWSSDNSQPRQIFSFRPLD
ncbi:hypothetical protein AMTR_s00094p00127780 [Amborella trichopoda]|uniref:Uncharacterized protein n=1 Tax=Amborella trichopoda TaxID=13333 RepID=W1NP81_AMBTC|nr:hypothetical protein AMTR_s00094p00127780 [Amborella trichopoda]